MAVENSYLSFMEDQLGGVTFLTKKMFGGIGLFHEGVMFGMIGGNVLRFKVDSTNESDFTSRDMKPYRSTSKKKGMPYWEVPQEIIEDREQLKIWAQKAIAVASSAKK